MPPIYARYIADKGIDMAVDEDDGRLYAPGRHMSDTRFCAISYRKYSARQVIRASFNTVNNTHATLIIICSIIGDKMPLLLLSFRRSLVAGQASNYNIRHSAIDVIA